ncbi:MAG: pyruvate formate-lyase-activating protein [Rikenellaceae bacterium]
MLRVHSYESMGTVDGPGLRFVIFLQGCNFKCLYCANPDTISMQGGEEIHDNEIFRMVHDSKPYFGRRGGVTFSGGEPTIQAKGLIPLIERFQAAGIHTCIDTNGSVWNSDVETLLGLVDLVLLDVKQIAPAKHQDLTKHSNEQTLRTAEWLEEHSRPFYLRYVLVPGISNAQEDMERLGETLKGYKMIKQVEILPYHRLGIHKYEALGMEYKLHDTKECTAEDLTMAETIMGNYFDNVVVY